MTWRRFSTLLGGLSADSRWMLALRADNPGGRVLVTDPDATRAFAAGLARM